MSSLHYLTLPKKLFEIWTVVLEKTLESPLDCKEIQPVHPKGDQSWVFIGRIDVEAEILILRLPDAKNWFTGKAPDAGKDWRQKVKGMAEAEMAGWHHWLDGHEFEQALGVGDGQGSLVCCSPWGCKESDTTVSELNWRNYSKSFNLSLLSLLIDKVGIIMGPPYGIVKRINWANWC